MCDWFDPAYKAGGPIRSCINFALQMQNEYDIFILTGNKDLNDTEPLKGIISDQWQTYRDNIRVYYNGGGMSQSFWKKIINEIQPDFIYLNSVFSRPYTIQPMIYCKLSGIGAKLIMSPRGMLRPSALQFKSTKKKLFLSMLKGLGIHRIIHF
ncbi:MAG: glycosyltransferase, partial [Chitinophagaceae bacterium]|nr:glycosyltransferase [Chitinophagaceae bacterium]